ncbi:unnamed protein product [Macrosiphum euphorbiae]|uniref:CCHC-type domain-containing protein n=1 Tax=Macrosiphum euphorbiae TaxID=13131 RepID=A0AAV0XA51_9HEMI|nr:unnamed protein product [Macrosiphum euphorbiae]
MPSHSPDASMDTTAQHLARTSPAPATSAAGASAAATAGSQPEPKKQKTKEKPVSTLDRYATFIAQEIDLAISRLNCEVDAAYELATSMYGAEGHPLSAFAKDRHDNLVYIRDNLAELLNDKLKLKGFARAARKYDDPTDATTQTTDFATSISTSDAQTDTDLVPSWWLSDGFTQTGAATRSRRPATPRIADTAAESASETENENSSEVGTVDTAAESAAETENVRWSVVARKKARPRNKATADPSQAQSTHVARQQPKSYPRKPPAIMIKPAAGRSYSDTVRAVRSCGLTMADLGSSLVMRETQGGSLLMELPRGDNSAAAAKKIAAAFSERLGSDIGRISQLGVLVDVEVLDLDSCATADDVLEALRDTVTSEDNNTLAADRASICDVRIWPTKSKQQIASARMPRHLATQIPSISVGYSKCRVRPRTLPPERCYRCQMFGHNARKCTSEVDRTGACWRCGLNGHDSKSCTEPDDSCLACHLAGLPKVSHKPGSGACAARRQAASPTATSRNA